MPTLLLLLLSLSLLLLLLLSLSLSSLLLLLLLFYHDILIYVNLRMNNNKIVCEFNFISQNPRLRIFLIVCMYLCIYLCYASWLNEKRYRPEIWYTYYHRPSLKTSFLFFRKKWPWVLTSKNCSVTRIFRISHWLPFFSLNEICLLAELILCMHVFYRCKLLNFYLLLMLDLVLN